LLSLTSCWNAAIGNVLVRQDTITGEFKNGKLLPQWSRKYWNNFIK
jgi:hypothetical protein